MFDPVQQHQKLPQELPHMLADLYVNANMCEAVATELLASAFSPYVSSTVQ